MATVADPSTYVIEPTAPGMSSLGGNFGQAIGPIVAAQLVAFTGGYTSVWVAASIIVLIAAFAIVPVKRAQ